MEHLSLPKIKVLDAQDDLFQFKECFVNEENLIYVDGNSLGKLPKESIEISKKIVEYQWGSRLIRSWNEHWIDLPQKLAAKIAKIVGAHPDEIFVGDSTSLNLYKSLFAVLNLQQGKTEVVTDCLNFPTDYYVLDGILKQHFPKHKVIKVESENEITTDLSALENAVSKENALLTLSHVTYKSWFLYPMKEVNQIADKNGSIVVWDLSHSVGSVPVNLNENKAEIAVGCTYKYLNGGPGAPAFLYVSHDMQAKLNNPIWSWFGHATPFDFSPDFKPHSGIQKFAVGTPHVLSLAIMEGGLNVHIKAGLKAIREKSIKQTELLIQLFDVHLKPLGYELASPRNVKYRGSHISLVHSEGYRINRALIAPKGTSKEIIPDFRPPHFIRIGIAPLYNSYEDVYEVVMRLKAIVQNKEFEQYSEERLTVT
jgi:kynureninase